FCVDRGPPRSSTAILSPVGPSSLARMPPVQPMPTMTTSTGGSLVAMVRAPSGHVLDAGGIGDVPVAVAVFLGVLGVVRQHAGEADHLPGGLILVAAVDRVREHPLHHVLIERDEERAARQIAGERDLAASEILEERLLLLRRAAREIL